MEKKVEETIETICDWIQKEMSEENALVSEETIGMTNALANLVSARAGLTKNITTDAEAIYLAVRKANHDRDVNVQV